MLFNTSLVLLLVRARLSGMDRTLAEASEDLFATPWRTFRQITFPLLLPAIVAGFLLSFTFSFDDYVITTFVSGPGSSTLPLFIFGQVKRGVTPETNAVATMILGVHPGHAAGRADRADLASAPGGAARRHGHGRGRHRGLAGHAVQVTGFRLQDDGQGRSGDRRQATAVGADRPASAARDAALSVRSQGRSRSGRPKWP